MTHASFFSGVGGLDMGLESAGWSTVSFSEIDPYASAVLARHWPAVPNLGCIQTLAGRYVAHDHIAGSGGLVCVPLGSRDRLARPERSECGPDAGTAAAGAALWTGGFPCQDFSVAGKRRGFAGERSSLAYAFLELVERHRPPAIILENVPGLLSSHRGRDFYALQRRMAELGYVGAYRILDARYFGVPQRRRRVFIVALDARTGATEDDAAEVLSVGTRCDRHPATGSQAGPGTTAGPVERPHGVVADGAQSTRTIQAGFGHHGYTYGDQDVDGGLLQIANGLRASDGHHGHGSPRGDGGDNLVVSETGAGWWSEGVSALRSQTGGMPAQMVVNALDTKRGGPDDNDAQAGHLIAGTIRAHVRPGSNTDHSIVGDYAEGPDPLLPEGLDSHRYRCCGNGVVAPVAEFVGERLRVVVERLRERAA